MKSSEMWGKADYYQKDLIMYKLSQLNFHIELSSTDSIMTLPECQIEQHANLLQQCFFGTDAAGDVLDVDFAKSNQGFAAAASNDQKGYIFALQDIMLDWKEASFWCKDIRSYSETDRYNDMSLETFERCVVLIYLQYFLTPVATLLLPHFTLTMLHGITV